MAKLRDYDWYTTYATSDIRDNGNPVDVLQDFYIPALSCSIRYDRVAGYFTSSSLAAASQGFSQFVSNEGKARMVVGAQLAQDDAQAIIQGDQQRLQARMEEELEGIEAWPEAQRNGVELLAWMVTHGHLEIQVGIRVDNKNGTAQPFDYGGDGYLHEKWALFSDDKDQIYVGGSLNESQTALSINAENIEVDLSWDSGRTRDKILQKCRNFEAMWSGKHPSIRTFSLPDAIQQRLVQIVQNAGTIKEIDDTFFRWTPEPPSESVDLNEPDSLTTEELARFALIRLAPLLPGGVWVGVETSPVNPWPHQRFVAQRLIQSYPQNHLLCDEVGLGKTIEAGLVFRGLWLAGEAASIRVFAPASLTRQWLWEMSDKFLMPFKRRVASNGNTEVIDPWENEIEKTKGNFFDSPLELISTGLITNKRSGASLKSMPETDMLLVDEAHKARRGAPDDRTRAAQYNKLYQSLQEALYPKARSLLLATATPMQLNRVEAFDLIRMMPAAGTVQFSEDLCDIFYRIRDNLVNGENLTSYEREWLRRYLRNVRKSAQHQWFFVRDYVLDSLSSPDLDAFIDHDSDPLWGWQSFGVALNMLGPLGRTMLRHTRGLLREYQKAGLLNEKLARRTVKPATIKLDPQEKTAYEHLQSYCADLAEHIAANIESGEQRAAIGFYLSFLRLRFSSSFHALRQTFLRRLDKIDLTLKHQERSKASDWDVSSIDSLEALEEDSDTEDDLAFLVLKNRQTADLVWEKEEVYKLLRYMDDLPDLPSKTRQLFADIDRRRDPSTRKIRQMVVFTRYAETMQDLGSRLSSRIPDCPIATFSGSGGFIRWGNTAEWEQVGRSRVKQEFLADNIEILLCTDAAAEGLNLQTADLLINFDLPWNPMMLEQRIGRIDRIGQKHDDIYVLNYLYQGSVEEAVYVRLFKRFTEALSITGEQQFSILPIQQEDFERLSRTPQETDHITEEQLIKEAEQRAERIRDRQKLTNYDPEAQREAYERLATTGETEPPVTLDFIWETLTESPYLQQQGCCIETFPHGKAMKIVGVIGVTDDILITTSRSLYENGLPSDDPRRLFFASYGDPVFEELLSNVLSQQKEVLQAANDKEPLKEIRIDETSIKTASDVPKATDATSQLITLLPRRKQASPAPARDQNRAGHLQYNVLLATAAAVARKMLRQAQDGPAAQLRQIDKFMNDLSRRRPPKAQIPAEVPNQAAVDANQDNLLWNLKRRGNSLSPELDPLLLGVCRSSIERTLKRAKKDRTDGESIAGQLQRAARVGPRGSSR